MTAFIARMTVPPARQAEFEKLCAELSETAHRVEPGLVVYDVARHREDRDTYVFYARFRDEEAFQWHQQAGFHQRLVPPILDCVDGEMDLQFFDWVA